MPIQFDNYEQSKIDRLKNHLVMMAAKGQPKHYEIFVDMLKAIPKTDIAEEFDGYEDYLTPDSEQVKIVIYNTDKSPRNDQYVFVLKARTRDEAQHMGLSGAPMMHSSKSYQQWRETQTEKERAAWEMELLKKENAELKEQLAESEELADKLADLVEQAKANANKIGGVHWGEVFSVAMEGLLKRNAHNIARIPGAEGFAGIFAPENKTIPISEAQGEVSFKKKDEGQAPSLSQQEKLFLELMSQLQQLFTEEELDKVMAVLDALSRDKSQLQTLVELMQDENQNS